MSMPADKFMQILYTEPPEVVAQLWASVVEENNRLRKAIEKTEVDKLLKDQQLLNIEEKVKLLRRDLFGKKSEVRAGDRPRDKSQGEAQLFSQAAFPSPESRGAKNTDALETQVIDHHLTNEELVEEGKLRGVQNPSADQWEETELFDQVTKIQIIERRYIKEVHKKFKKKLKSEFNPDPEKEVFVTASGPDALLPGMNYTTEFVASVVADKFISHMPLERQTREMESLGLKGMKTSTLSRLCALAAATLEPVQEKILNELKASDLALHLDETPWKIQNKNEKDGYMWIISNRYGSVYTFKPTRSGQVMKDLLHNYCGPVVTDGFSGYNALDENKIKQAYCWAHARREFLKIEEHDPSVKPILDEIDHLFEIERRAKSFDELKNLRQAQSKLAIEKIRDLLIEEYSKSRDGSQKRKAIEYVTKRWDGFKVFLDDVRVPMSNNEAERTIRHAVVGRKNYYGSGNHTGAESAATLFTVIESCKKNDIDPRTFLIMALTRAARDQTIETPLEYTRRLRQ